MVELVVMVMGGVEGSMAEVEELLYEDQSEYRQIFTNGSFTGTQLALAALTLGALTAPFLLLNGLGPQGQAGSSNGGGSSYGYQNRGARRGDTDYRSRNQHTDERLSWIARVPQVIQMAQQMFEDQRK